MNKFQLFSCAALLFFGSCTKSNDTGAPTTPPSTKPDTTKNTGGGTSTTPGTQLVSYEANYTSSVKTKLLWESAVYDAFGNVVQKKYREYINPDEPSNKLFSEKLTYSTNNKAIARVVDIVSESGSVSFANYIKEDLTYNGDLLVEKKMPYDRIEYKYENNKIDKATLYSSAFGSEVLARNDTYVYDIKGRLININGIIPASVDMLASTAKYIYEYDDHDNLTRNSYVNNRDGFASNTYFKSKYDTNNRVIELVQSEYEASLYIKFEITYNENGTIKSKKLSSAENIAGPFTYLGDVSYIYTYK